jgi:hypothetical protein
MKLLVKRYSVSKKSRTQLLLKPLFQAILNFMGLLKHHLVLNFI